MYMDSAFTWEASEDDQYGFINQALEVMITERFGFETWEQISNLCEAKVASPFESRIVYDDNLTFGIVSAASKVTGQSCNRIWELFGESFFDFCEDSGYGKIVRVLGSTLKDFLQNLDALHDYLSSIFPGMRAPAFRVTERPDGALILHYYSERSGLEWIVVGLVKTAARKLHDLDVEVEILQHATDHVQFLVRKKCSSQGELGGQFDPVELLSLDPKMSPATFIKLFPFHIMLSRDLKIVQAGEIVSRVIKEVEDPKYNFRDIFQIVKPQIDPVYDSIVANTNTVFLVRAKDKIRLSPRRSVGNAHAVLHPTTSGLKLTVPSEQEDSDITHRKRMSLKGQMMHLEEADHILFLCSPSVGNLDDLVERGLYLSDIPMHDSTRDLVLLSEQYRAEYELTQKLEVVNDKLQQTYRELEIEKQLTDKLLYSILPPTVANNLRVGKPVEAVKYKSVSILFSGLCEFNAFCSKNSAFKVVNLLNDIYTRFDAIADPRVHNVYKVETVGDKYMLASGLPEKSETHARNIARVALDLIDVAPKLADDDVTLKVTIGIHSGEIVAGVVGQKLPHYAVFGSTVCIASRMESRGLPGQINISEATQKELLKHDSKDERMIIKNRGAIYVKGVREQMMCYTLSRDKSSRCKSAAETNCLGETSSDKREETFYDLHFRRQSSLRDSSVDFGSVHPSLHITDTTQDILNSAAICLSSMLQERRHSFEG